MFIRITPLDTWFFRTGRPFTGGEDTWSDYMFPPSPATLYGAVRSLMIFKRGSLKDFLIGKWKEDLGTPDNKGSLNIKGPFLFNQEIYFRTPMDIVSLKGEEECQLLELKGKTPLFISNYNLEEFLVWRKRNLVDEPGGWLSLTYFIDYIKAQGNSFCTVSDRDLYSEEPKIGIKRNRRTLTAEEGFLYRIPLIRLRKDVGLIVEVEGINDFPDEGILQLGGESKGAHFEKIEDPFKELKEVNFTLNNGLFKLYLATPAVFKNGWLPEWLDGDTYEGEFNGIKLKLIACAIGKPVAIGGWDMARGTAKPLRRAVPAGSVYYFKMLDDTKPGAVKKVFHFRNISDINPEEGFGLSILGEVRI